MPNSIRYSLFLVGLLAAVVAWGCQARKETSTRVPAPLRIFQSFSTSIEYPDAATPLSEDLLLTPPPMTALRNDPTAYRDLKLEEAIQIALANAKVLRDLGGQLIRTPQNAVTVYGAAVQESDPRYGIEGALAAFDATY